MPGPMDPQQPPQQNPADPMGDPSFRAYVAQRIALNQQMQDAQQKAQEHNTSIGSRIGNALTLLGGGTQQDIDAQRARAYQPVNDILARQKAMGDLTDVQGKAQNVESTARGNAMAMAAQDPESILTRRSRAMMAPIVGADLASKLTAADFDAALKSAKEGGDLKRTLAEAAAARANAGKTSAEAAQVAPNAGSVRAVQAAEVPLKGAQTSQAQAEADYKKMLTGGEVVPGYSRGGIPIDEQEAKKINDQYQDYTGSKQTIHDIMDLTGDKDFIADAAIRAKLQPRLAELTGKLRSSVGMRSLAGPEMEFANKFINDPTAITPQNILQWTHNKERFGAVEKGLDQGWENTVKAKDLRKKAKPGEMINVISPEGKAGQIPAEKLDAALKRGFKRA